MNSRSEKNGENKMPTAINLIIPVIQPVSNLSVLKISNPFSSINTVIMVVKNKKVAIMDKIIT